MSTMSSLHHSHDLRLSISLVSFKSEPVIADMYVNNLFANCWDQNSSHAEVWDFCQCQYRQYFLKLQAPECIYEAECVDKQIAEIFCLLT
ncbi:hypothetical protein Pyn_06426 [Prunus yedoensis var. nudiflora]|uniref:Uncharacterized protein n=1 Tax=Prunus yedoensis var. nudiflora TaxID=2094558 RepID=A0A314YIE8_PRUYE|nr:hypothetical protein Pyn_06426 [Prunus yedoensis var. nudiflora]